MFWNKVVDGEMSAELCHLLWTFLPSCCGSIVHDLCEPILLRLWPVSDCLPRQKR